MKNRFYVAAIALSALWLSSCSKSDDNSSSGKATMNMRLTDAPAEYDAIYLDIQSVEVTMEGHAAVTYMPARAGIYNILSFRNGMDTLLVSAQVPTGKISQVRLVLGNNNSIVVNGVSHPLTTPSGQTSGVKLNLNQTFEAGGSYDMWIDFDAAHSINETGSGKYMLKPVIRAYSSLTNGRIEGYILPGAALASVYAINATDTFGAIPDPDHAYFKISGLPEGTYKLWIHAGLGIYSDMTVNNVQVTFGSVTNVGSLTLTP